MSERYAAVFSRPQRSRTTVVRRPTWIRCSRSQIEVSCAGKPREKISGSARMITSRDRILTTHVGSSPRNEKLSELLVRREAGEKIDEQEFATEMDTAVRHVVEMQAWA